LEEFGAMDRSLTGDSVRDARLSGVKTEGTLYQAFVKTGRLGRIVVASITRRLIWERGSRYPYTAKYKARCHATNLLLIFKKSRGDVHHSFVINQSHYLL